MWMILSSEYIQLKIWKTFCQTPRNGFDFDDEIWFENKSQPLLITDKVKHSGKVRKNISNTLWLSQLYTSWSIHSSGIFVICKWPYLVIPMSRVLCHTTKDRHRNTWWDAQTLFLNLKASLYEHSKSVTLELSCQPETSIWVCST